MQDISTGDLIRDRLEEAVMISPEREAWEDRLEQFLEERERDAPDESCKAFVRLLLEMMTDFTDPFLNDEE